MNESTVRLSMKQVLVFIALGLVFLAVAFGLGRYSVKPVEVIKEVVRVDSIYVIKYKADSASKKRAEAFVDSITKTYTKKPQTVLREIRQWYKDNE